MSTTRTYTNEITDLNNRVTKVETSVSALASTVEKFVDKSDRNYEGLDKKIDGLTNQLSNYGRPNWGVIASLFAIAMAIIGYFVTSYVNPINEKHNQLESRMDRTQTTINNIMDENRKVRDMVIEDNVKWELWEKGLLKQSQ